MILNLELGNWKKTFTNSSHRATRNLYFMSAKQISKIYQLTIYNIRVRDSYIPSTLS